MPIILSRSSPGLLPPIQTDNFPYLRPVPDLITYYENLDTALEDTSPITMSKMPAPFPSPFSTLRQSLSTTFTTPRRAHTTQASADSTFSSAASSVSTSPQSSLRGATFARSRTWNSSRSRSRSPRSMRSYSNSPVLLSRRPSSIDLALLEEEELSHHDKGVGLGLEMMEPRPIVPVMVAPTAGIFEEPMEEDIERQPFVMGGILEVMEERS